MIEIVTSVLNKNSLLYGSDEIRMKNFDPSCVDMKGEDISTIFIKDCAAIVAITPNNQIILKKEYRHCYGEELIEIPAGVLDKNEDPLNAAKRELEEETGYRSEKWTYLGKAVESSAKFTNYMYIFLAECCEKVSDQKLDYREYLEVIEAGLDEAVEMIMNNEIICSSSIGAILKVERMKKT